MDARHTTHDTQKLKARFFRVLLVLCQKNLSDKMLFI
jgi:hypothetical protein